MRNWRDTIVKSIYYKRLIGNKGIYIMSEDWDNLLILDACRYDMFKDINNIKGKLEFRISRGACTNEFLRENFKGKKFKDTIYITANPLIDYHVPNSFAKIISVWKDGWSDEYETVLPETMLKYAIEANKVSKDRRLIIHFMQPHYPFIGGKSREKIGEHEGILSRNLFFENAKTDHATQEVWNLLKEGKIDKKTAWEAYEENLQIVLEYVEKLVDKLEGKIVISSDHGNLFDEWLFPFPIKEFGHPCGIYAKNLVKVPWLVIERKNRKRVIEERRSDQMLLEKERIKAVAKRLKIL